MAKTLPSTSSDSSASSMTVTLTRNQSAAKISERLGEALKRHGVTIREFDSTESSLLLLLSYDGFECIELHLVQPKAEVSTNESGSEEQASTLKGASEPAKTKGPRIAIIVDDGGNGGIVTEDVLKLSNALTLAILPNARATTQTAESAHELGFEIMLHMPMENGAPTQNYPGEILTSMSSEEILALTDEALAQVPNAVGVNNHTGSRFTADENSMLVFLELMKKRGLYFVDSRTTSATVADAVAQSVGVPFARRDIFLDHLEHKRDADYVREKFTELIATAKQNGKAIAICHFWPTSVKVLGEMLPIVAREGIELVHASELVL